MSNTNFVLSLKEELALIRTYIWHTKRDESRLRRKLSSIELKIEQSRRQLRDVLKFMKQHQNGIDVHLKKLSKTENTLREQIDNIFHEPMAKEIKKYNNKHNNLSNGKRKQTKRAKKLNSDLIEIVQHRNDHESRLDSSYCTFKLISSLLSDETKPNQYAYNTMDDINNNIELDDNISPSVSEYIYYRTEISKIQRELVECVEKRELANQAQYDTKLLLKKQIPKKCIKCHCQCKHRDKQLIICSSTLIYDSDSDNSDNSDSGSSVVVSIIISKEILRNELIKLGQDIHQRSGLIRQQRRDGICHLRVFVGSELITWMVKSGIVKTRYEASILSSLLIDGGYIYCAYSKPKTKAKAKYKNNYNYNRKSNTKRILLLTTKNPSITLKPPSVLSETRSLTTLSSSLLMCTPNKLLLGGGSPVAIDDNNNNNNNNMNSMNSTSSVISMASSLSAMSAISGTSSSIFSNRSSSPSSESQSSSLSLINNAAFVNSECNVNPIDCSCLCRYCIASNKALNLSFNDTNDLYRFRCDDSRIERISKMGWLEKFGRFRSKKRHFIWDGVRRQLREYKTKGDIVPLYKYPFNKNTQIKTSANDECVVCIIFITNSNPNTNTNAKTKTNTNHILKLKAASCRERDSWLRVLKNHSHTNNNHMNGNHDNDNNNEIMNNNNKNYEEYRHLRMTNRLKWSSLFISVKATSSFIKSFRAFIISQNKLERCHKTEIENELNKLFTTKESPICILFDSFSRLFLEPFYAININQLQIESIDSIISLCVDDLSSFLQICQNRLINLLLPASLRLNITSNHNHTHNNHSNRPVIKLLNKLIKRCIYSHCFCASVYNTIFPLYQRVHHDVDQQLYEISINSQDLSTKNYKISKELQIDKDWVNYKNNNNNMNIDMNGNPNKNNSNNNNVDSILKLDSSKLKKAKNNIQSIINIESPKYIESESPNIKHLNNDIFAFPSSPFQPCIDKLWEMSYCHTPTKKLQCLVELQQLVIKCIDNYRQNEFNKNNNNEEDEDGDGEEEEEEEEKEEEEEEVNENGMSIESLDYISDEDDFQDTNKNLNILNMNSNKTRKANARTHGIIIGDDEDEDDEDTNVSLISYESATSEYWTQSLKVQQIQHNKNNKNKSKSQTKNKNKSKNKKCKQLLIASDDMIPLFCYALVQSQIQSVNAEIAFMNDFMSDEEKQMKAGFYLTTLQAATSALLDKKLPIPH